MSFSETSALLCESWPQDTEEMLTPVARAVPLNQCMRREGAGNSVERLSRGFPMLSRKYMYKNHKHNLVITVNPQKIDQYVGGNCHHKKIADEYLKPFAHFQTIARGLIKCYTPFIIPKKHYIEPFPVESMERYRRIMDLFRNLPNYKKSEWYVDLKNRLKNSEIVFHKTIEIRSIGDLDAFFDGYLLGMIRSMRDEGYQAAQGFGAVMIGPGGEIHKANAGVHRFIIGRMLGLKTMPFVVKGVHSCWAEENLVKSRPRDVPKMLRFLKIVQEKNQ